MNRSKIFLGASATLLAVAGVAATRAAKFGTITACYYTQVNALNPAKIIVGNQPCTVTTNPLFPRCIYYTTGPDHTGTSFPLYTGIGPNKCTNPVKYGAF